MIMNLRYEPSDPYVVHAAFTTDVDSDESVEWIIGRDLLIEGLEGPAGEGDVRIWPTGEEGYRDLYILLNSPSGTALLKAPEREFKAFLRETEAVVPRGAELRHSDFDRLLAHFLAEG
ncbi:SsgA family sporulation/cell division regulator [Streptomyces chengbuensis]|nr:SsgA family sporulation/cell division regulator [Streptomyces sp. HUAS CB01]WJY48426.1 SsgA family sporulation/cell division regulator [Streptomyces sp. HUAS CB01]